MESYFDSLLKSNNIKILLKCYHIIILIKKTNNNNNNNNNNK